MPAAEIHLDGITKLPRTDGSTTIVPAEYWNERKNENSPIDLYNKFSEITELIIITANQDTILENVPFVGLTKRIKIIALDGDHDFKGLSRQHLINTIKDILF